MDHLYEAAGVDTFIATPLTRGPWFAGAQHGSAPAALLARQVERFPTDEPMHPARVTIDLLGPVPLGKVQVRTSVRKPGKRVQLMEAVMSSEDREVACASAWLIAETEGTPPVAGSPPPAPPDPLATHTPPPWFAGPGFHTDAVNVQFVSGSFTEPGPATVWVKLLAEVVGGEPVSPWMRAMAAADFGNGVAAIADPRTHYFINTDLTVSLAGPPVGEWVGLAAETYPGPCGAAVAGSVVYDLGGAIGTSAQTLMMHSRD